MDKIIPFDKDAESAVLGAVIVNPARYKIIADMSSDDFYDKRSKLAFELLPKYVDNNKHDIIVLKEIAEKRGVKDIVEFMKYIFSLMDTVPCTDAESVKHYAEIIKEKSNRRQKITQFEKSLKELYNPAIETSKIDDDICNMMFRAEKQVDELVTFGQAFDEFFADLEQRRKSGKIIPGLSTGFEKLDIMTGGLENGRLYVFGGRPAMGKTALALNILSNIVLSGKRVALFSLEMGRKEIAKRIVSSVGQIKAAKLKAAKVDENEYPKLGEAADKLADRLIVNDNSVQTASGILSNCLRYNANNRNSDNKIDAVVIDYLQLLSNDNKRLDRRIAIGESSRICKMMAKQLDCPVILLSQLSRANEARQEKMPILSDLRESGDIEQDADVVAFVHRPEYYKLTSENHGLAQINIAKNRDGEVGTIDLKWDKTTTTFSNIGGGYDFET